jgi:hypothetical protein
MASQGAAQTSTVFTDVMPHLMGLTTGLGVSASQAQDAALVPLTFSLSGVRTNTDRPSLVKAAATAQGEASPATYQYAVTAGSMWWDRVHILPLAKINFGNIITEQTADYEVYSAYRTQDVTLTSVVNNALPGVSLPGLFLPVSIPAQTSIVDASTTSNMSDTFQLGTTVLLDVAAGQDGLPSFDTTLDFGFSTGELILLGIAGERIVFIPMQYDTPVTESLQFLTDVIEGLSGKEQRIALRDNPRQVFVVDYRLDGQEQQHMESFLMDWGHNTFAFPLWHEACFLTSNASSGVVQLQTSGALDVDFRVGGLAVVMSANLTFDVLNLTAVTDTLITFSSSTTNSYSIGDKIMPLRTAVLGKPVVGRRYPNNLRHFRLTFDVTDNDTGTLAGSTTPGFWSLYDGHVLFDDGNVLRSTMREKFDRRVFKIDNQTGIIEQSSLWDRYKRTHQKGFIARSRAEIIELRKVLIALAGRQKAFFIPTFTDDLTVVAQLQNGTTTMDIDRIEYVRFVRNRRPKKILKISFNNGDPDLIRIVQSSTQVDSSTERLTLDTAWTSTVPVSEIERVQFYEMVRFDNDAFKIKHLHGSLAELFAPVRTVYDDND